MLMATAGGIKNAPRRRRIIHELSCRPHLSRRKIAAAVGAYPFETVLDAIAAEGALEGADHRVGGRWRQILVATFAAWAEFEHSKVSLYSLYVISFPSIKISHST
jgi:hypothetical protein